MVWKGPGSSVGIVTGYGLDAPGIEFRWGWDFAHIHTSHINMQTVCVVQRKEKATAAATRTASTYKDF
jgi:hypothetical protein